MAKPIKTTPILRSSDAEIFNRKLDENKKSKVTNSRLMEIKATAKQFQAILKK
ncbi:hypothetical protein QWY99_16670 [Flavobacterium branchiarum]|uniref:Uncharacterized protein n=1 Tax=Flavobacterium branchiarum TaxID=1114870 RepID=A0ABV5FM46_9FLAO|nr:hypothetical protein [Flavobacterium branchiarum]MDN3674677.1 hypothetical protein [Flavobacterium branchiarum]